jgi:hypothetical protein
MKREGWRMSEVDGIGEIVTGTLVAGAVEPATGEQPGGGPGGKCLNCHAALTGPYCHQCGQRAEIHRSLRTYFTDFAAGLFNFEGKFWRTLPMLAWCPGDLTRRYVDGERARFISPIALYLFSVFAMFAVLGFSGALDSNLNSGMQSGIATAIADEEETVAKLEKDRAEAVAAGTDVSAIDRRLASTREDLEDLRKVKSGVLVIDKDDNIDQAPPWIRDVAQRAQEDPDAVVYNIQDAASKYSWLLIPISVPFLWILFPLRRRHMFDHAVFVTYSLSFMMMLAILAGILVWMNMPVLASLLIFVPPWHMYRQLKGAYRLGTFSALVRTFLLLTFACIAIGFFAAAIFGLGLFA